ncbi:MAG: hypothetical protein IPH61_07005 [Bacteroidetes bacterium]|nr:hypothetical protein [Bacteroidota bacterium]
MKYELKPMAVSIIAPFIFLIWAIVSFLWEGSYWLSARELWK